MIAFVTGGTGFIGSHVVRALLARGDQVRCLVRPEGRRDNLAGLRVETVTGDITAAAPVLAEAMRGCQLLFHCAADYRLSAPKEALVRNNVDGTRRVLGAAALAGVARVVYTSSVGALATTREGRPATEETPTALGEMVGAYKRSKFLAEREADAWAARGLDVVIVNPASPVGERDLKPTPTGQMIVDYLNRRMRAYVETGLNVIDVADVAAGHLLAAARGVRGQRYILGHRNLSLREIFERLAAITGIPAPRVKLPHWIPLALAALEAPVARLRGVAPRIPLEGVRMSRATMYFDASKAVRELGLPQSPVDDAFARAVTWFRDHGYAPS